MGLLESAAAGRARTLAVSWLGRVPYSEALELQDRAVEARRSGASGDRLILLEHPPVITRGRSARVDTLLRTPAELAALGVDVFDVPRGGDVTYHAPGQLVGYLVVDLAAEAAARGASAHGPDVHRFLRRIEAGLVDALDALGVSARPVSGMTGVFVRGHVGGDPAGSMGSTGSMSTAGPAGPAGPTGPDGDTAVPPRKIASIGVGLRGGVSFHGFALNVTVDLDGFGAIVPCGLDGVEMTSVARELPARAGEAARDLPGGGDLDAAARGAVTSAFRRRFELP